MMERRKSISRPAWRSLKRPSCGTRRSPMSSSAMTLRRETSCSARAAPSTWRTGAITPSMRKRICAPRAVHSMCTSLAPSCRASKSVALSRRTTGEAASASDRAESSSTTAAPGSAVPSPSSTSARARKSASPLPSQWTSAAGSQRCQSTAACRRASTLCSSSTSGSRSASRTSCGAPAGPPWASTARQRCAWACGQRSKSSCQGPCSAGRQS